MNSVYDVILTTQGGVEFSFNPLSNWRTIEPVTSYSGAIINYSKTDYIQVKETKAEVIEKIKNAKRIL